MKANPNFPLQYIWVLGGSALPTVRHKVTIAPTDGKHNVVFVQEGKRKTVVVEPNDFYLPPNTITITPPTGVDFWTYSEYTGAVALINVTQDITITGACRKMVHTHDEIKAQRFQHEDIKNFHLTHDDIKGPVVP